MPDDSSLCIVQREKCWDTLLPSLLPTLHSVVFPPALWLPPPAAARSLSVIHPLSSCLPPLPVLCSAPSSSVSLPADGLSVSQTTTSHQRSPESRDRSCILGSSDTAHNEEEEEEELVRKEDQCNIHHWDVDQLLWICSLDGVKELELRPEVTEKPFHSRSFLVHHIQVASHYSPTNGPSGAAQESIHHSSTVVNITQTEPAALLLHHKTTSMFSIHTFS
ncbi:unnamed protein product [Pleuronectes platessa]|uniref:Uncharacterized protein n=1 Tax=Pleuronectes platessa TaxID=8262 RepID=A0A9N7TKS8_PLEPL|nr:unnamed protein product [Pleuronectes platessa]